MTDAQDRFEKYLRDEARVADGFSTLGSSTSGKRDELRADFLRDMADDFRTKMPPEHLQILESLSDGNLRALAMGARLAAPWLKPPAD
jgi:hypothetical protein